MFLHFEYIFNIKVVHARIHSHITLTGTYRILQNLFNILCNSHKTIKTVSCMGDTKIEQITLTNCSKNVADDRQIQYRAPKRGFLCAIAPACGAFR